MGRSPALGPASCPALWQGTAGGGRKGILRNSLLPRRSSGICVSRAELRRVAALGAGHRALCLGTDSTLRSIPDSFRPEVTLLRR